MCSLPGIDVLVATPGRIMDHLERGTLKLSNVRHVVLDEADEMLDMGFSKDIEQILGFVDMSKSQCVMFSATTPDWIEQLARQYLKNPLRLDASNDGESRTATTVRAAQSLYSNRCSLGCL
jgi:ATP-dependent RNA helicase DDX21